MTFEEYNSLRHEITQKLANKYTLLCVDVGDNIALVGNDFCIAFRFGRGETSIDYFWMQNGELYEYPFNNFVASSFNINDRGDVGRKQGIYEYSIADLKILVKGLENHFKDILEGSKGWIEFYKKSKYYYKPRILHNDESIEIKKMFLHGKNYTSMKY